MTTRFTPASAERQVGAFCIDMAVVAAVFGIIVGVSSSLAAAGIGAFQTVVMMAVIEGSMGVTPGLLALGLRTVRAESQTMFQSGVLPAGMRRIAVKYLVILASVCVAFIGVVAVACSPLFARNPLKQGWADRAAKLAEISIRDTQAAVEAVPEMVPESMAASEPTPTLEPNLAPVMNSEAVHQPQPETVSVPESRLQAFPSTQVPQQPQAAPLAQAVPQGQPALQHPQELQQKPKRKRHAATPTPPSAPPAQQPQANPPVPLPPVPPRRPQYAGVLVFADGSQRQVPVPARIALGRAPSPKDAHDIAVAVPDTTGTVSRNHALLMLRSDAITVQDIGSTNGTRIAAPDGNVTELQPMAAPTLMPPNSSLQLGDIACKVFINLIS